MSELARRTPGASLEGQTMPPFEAAPQIQNDIQTFRLRAEAAPEAADERAAGMASTCQFIARLSDAAGEALGFGALREIQLSGTDRTCAVHVTQDQAGRHNLRGALAFKDVDPIELSRIARDIQP